MEQDRKEWVQAVDRDKAKVAKTPAAWVARRRQAPSATAFVRNAGRRSHTTVLYLALSANARSVEPL